MAMLKARSVFNTRKKKEFYTLKKFYKANLEIQYKHNVNVNVSDAIYAPKNKEVIDVREPIVDIRVVNDDIPIYAPPSYINVINVREPFEDIRVRGPTEDLRVVNNDILIDVRETSEDSINVINVREPIEDRRVIKDDVPVLQDENTNKKIYVDPKKGKKKSKKGRINY